MKQNEKLQGFVSFERRDSLGLHNKARWRLPRECIYGLFQLWAGGNEGECLIREVDVLLASSRKAITLKKTQVHFNKQKTYLVSLAQRENGFTLAMARLKIVSPVAIGVFIYERILCSLVFLPHLKLGQKSIKYWSPAEAVWMRPNLQLFWLAPSPSLAGDAGQLPVITDILSWQDFRVYLVHHHTPLHHPVRD